MGLKIVFINIPTQIQAPPPILMGLEETKLVQEELIKNGLQWNDIKTSNLEHLFSAKARWRPEASGEPVGSQPICSDQQLQNGGAP